VIARDIHEDDRLPTLAAFLAGLAQAAQPEATEAMRDGASDGTLGVTRMTVSLPFELDLLEEQGGYALDAAPPTQRTRTSVPPVLHRLTLTIVREDEAADDGRIGIETVES
jgi:hypothetical protein